MDLLLFLGSGVSVESGMPSVGDLTDYVLGKPVTVGDATWRAADSPVLRERYDGPRGVSLAAVHRLLNGLARVDGLYRRRVGRYPARAGGYARSGAIYRGEATYEDLYTLCERVHQSESGMSDNTADDAFVERMVRGVRAMTEGESTDARVEHLSRVAGIARRFIEDAVAELLADRPAIGLDVVARLAAAPWLGRLDVVTLNHDRLVEQVLRGAGVTYADGFGPPDGEVRWFDDATYDAPGVTRRVIKPHGSTDWYPFRPEKGGPYRLGTCAAADPSECRDGRGRRLVPQSPTPSFLTGLGKPVLYHTGPFADLHYRFLEALRGHTTLLVSGYGWGDLVVNHRLLGWLERSRRHALVLFHRNPEALVDRSMLLASKFDNLVETGRFVLDRRWLSEVPPAGIEQAVRKASGSAGGTSE